MSWPVIVFLVTTSTVIGISKYNSLWRSIRPSNRVRLMSICVLWPHNWASKQRGNKYAYSNSINTNNLTHHYLHPGTGWTNIDIVAMCEYPVNWLIVAASICGSRAWYDYHHWRRLVKVPYLAQSCVALFCKKAMCICFDELVHIFLCSPAVNNFQSATDKFVNFAWGNCCHFLPRKLNKTINDHIECMQNCETYNIYFFVYLWCVCWIWRKFIDALIMFFTHKSTHRLWKGPM